MNLWRDLSPEEIAEFKQWARENYIPFEPINGIYHPIIQKECALINEEAGHPQTKEIIK